MSKVNKGARSRKLLASVIVASLCAVVLGLAGCGGSAASGSASASGSTASESAQASSQAAASESGAAGAQAGETRTFVDSSDRSVEVPATIERVAITGPVSQMALLTLAPDMLVGLSNELSDVEMKYVGEQYGQLPVYGQIYGGKGDFNKEAVASADPQVIIDVGEAKDSIVADMDEIQAATGIPCVHIEATYDTYADAYTMLGDLLGKQDRAKELADYCNNAVKTTSEAIEGIAADKRAKVIYLLGDAGLNAMAKGSFQGTVVDAIADNVAVIENAGGSGLGSEVSFEQVALWDAPMIIFGPGSVYDKAADDESWKTLTAVKDGNFYEVPGEPYNWISSPPGINQVLGYQWFARLCYPDAFDDDIATVAKGYYKTFYGYELSDDEVSALIAKASPKK